METDQIKGWGFTAGTKISCNHVSKEFLAKQRGHYIGMTIPEKRGLFLVLRITVKYYFEFPNHVLEINAESHVSILTKTEDFNFSDTNPEAIDILKKILMETEDMIDEFCGHFIDLDGRVKRLSPSEILAEAKAIFHSYGQ